MTTEKQYFKREIDEKTFNSILTKKQEEILKTRGLITTNRKELETLIKSRLSARAVLRWLTSGPRRAAGRFRRKPMQEASRGEA